MKQTILLLAATALLSAGCTKSRNTSSSSSYTCTCSYWKNPLKDTTVTFNYYGVTQDSAKNACDYKQQVYISISGKGNASCRLE